MTAVPPIRREILVDADVETAFAIFTARIGDWWPLAELSVHGAGSTVAFEDGRIIERSVQGEEAVWGAVTEWQPGQRLSFTWHPGRAAEKASVVAVSFEDRDGRTLVTLHHSGWEVFADPDRARDEYDHGWPMVLGCYEEAASAPSPSTWAALMHTPGPAAPTAGSIFADPRFGEHLAFLGRMREAGYLVAAGPLTDTDGGGMTILRLPGASRHEEATRMATEDDLAVTSGLLRVDVHPWNVMVHALADF